MVLFYIYVCILVANNHGIVLHRRMYFSNKQPEYHTVSSSVAKVEHVCT